MTNEPGTAITFFSVPKLVETGDIESVNRHFGLKVIPDHEGTPYRYCAQFHITALELAKEAEIVLVEAIKESIRSNPDYNFLHVRVGTEETIQPYSDIVVISPNENKPGVRVTVFGDSRDQAIKRALFLENTCRNVIEVPRVHKTPDAAGEHFPWR